MVLVTHAHDRTLPELPLYLGDGGVYGLALIQCILQRAHVRRSKGFVSSPNILERLLNLTSRKTPYDFFARLGQNHSICIQTEIRTTRAHPPHPLQCLGQRLAAKVLRLLARELADGEVRLLLVGARTAEGYPKDLHLRGMGARILRLTAHLAR